MFQRILTDLERKRIRAYLKADGERTEAIQNVVSRMRRYGPRIKEDLELVEQLISVYESHVKKV
jgi:hypothetical protein